MEWDNWPNQGYPCKECRQRFECTKECKLRQNDDIQVDLKADYKPIKIDYDGLHLSCCGRPISSVRQVSLNCFIGATRHKKCKTKGCECTCHE